MNFAWITLFVYAFSVFKSDDPFLPYYCEFWIVYCVEPSLTICQSKITHVKLIDESTLLLGVSVNGRSSL